MNNYERQRSLYQHGIAFVTKGLLLVVLLVGITACNQEKPIHIATKPMTEQYILGEMLKILIEGETGLSVKITHGVGGGTSNIHPAILKGEFDMYPEYTGTAWNAVLKNSGIYQETLFNALQDQYAKQFQLEWVGMFGFNNTFGIAVRKEIAEQHGLKTYSDLAPISGQLVFGAEYDFFGRQDGFAALQETYGLAFKKTMDMDIGLKYQAISQGKIDVMNIFTTDGQLDSAPLSVLEDNKHLYPSYLCGVVVRTETLAKHPNLKAVLHKVTGTLDDAAMARLNYQVEIEKRDPKDVARTFLQQKKLLP